MSARTLFAPLSERPFRLHFLAQAWSVFGDNIAPIAVAFAVLGLTGSAADLGIVLAAHTIPIVVFLLMGGVWADRVSRRRLMMLADAVRFGTQAIFAALLILGDPAIWQLVILQALNGTATAFFRPAGSGLTPQTVSAARLQQANALLSMTFSFAAVAGPAVAGILIATVGAGWAIAVDALTFAISAFFLSRMTLKEEAPVERNTFLRDLASGWGEVRSRTWVWASIVNFMLFQVLVLATFQVLGPVVARQSLGGATAWAFITAAWGAGAVVGDVIGLRFEPRRPLFVAFATLLLVVPVMVLLGLAAPVPVIAVAAVFYGIAWSYPNILWYTALQSNVPQQALSRVSSYDWMGSMVLRPAGYAAAGPVAAIIGVRSTLVGASILYALATLATVAVPSIATLEPKRREQPAGETAAASPLGTE